MRGPNLAAVSLFAVVVAVAAAPAHAQLGIYDYYYWGGIGEQYYNQTRQLHEQDRRAAQALSQNRNLRIGSDVRNLHSGGAPSRLQPGASDEPPSREWWLQQRQLGTSRAAAPRPPLPDRGDTASTAGPSDPSTPATDQARDGAIRWPPLLLEQLFSAERATIEAPFMRYASGGSAVSATEYEAIIERAALMKRTLDRIAGQTTAAEFRAAQRFLDQLVAEARARIGQLRTIANVRANLIR